MPAAAPALSPCARPTHASGSVLSNALAAASAAIAGAGGVLVASLQRLQMRELEESSPLQLLGTRARWNLRWQT